MFLLAPRLPTPKCGCLFSPWLSVPSLFVEPKGSSFSSVPYTILFLCALYCICSVSPIFPLFWLLVQHTEFSLKPEITKFIWPTSFQRKIKTAGFLSSSSHPHSLENLPSVFFVWGPYPVVIRCQGVPPGVVGFKAGYIYIFAGETKQAIKSLYYTQSLLGHGNRDGA